MTLQQAILLALQVSILLTVVEFGLYTTAATVLYVVRRPSLLARSLVSLFVVMPIVAVALATAFDFLPAVEISLVSLAIVAVPPLLPGKQEKFGGDRAYAVGLLAIVALLSVAVMPAAVWLLSLYRERPFVTPYVGVAWLALKTVLLPLAAGMAMRAMAPAVAERIAKPVGVIAKVLLAVGVLGLLAGVLPPAFALIGNGTVVAFALFVVIGLAAGHFLGGPHEDHRMVLALATASRHPVMALTIAKANFPDEPNLLAAIVLYVLVNAAIGIPYHVWRQKLTTT